MSPIRHCPHRRIIHRLTASARRVFVVVASLAPLAGCGDPEVTPSASATNPPRGALELGSETWSALPASERAARIQALQADAGPEFAARESHPGVLSAAQASMGLRVNFEPGRVAVVATSSDETEPKPIELAAAAWGCPGQLALVVGSAPASGNAHSGVSYPHADFDEWYTVGPAGLEQGFTIRALPACAERGEPLKIRLRFSDSEGSIAQVEADGSAAVLSTPGHRAVHYSEPYARDAAGVEHAVRITNTDSLALEVDTRGVTLPLTIDPLIWEIQQNIRASDFKPPSFYANDFFGHAVSVSGDTAVIGSYSDDDKGADAGAAYVYVRIPPAKPGLRARWAPQQKLTASDAAAGDAFGKAVAISGDTLLVGAENESNAAGAAYVFVRNGKTWTQQQKLVPSDASAHAGFGSAVALLGDVAVVGAPHQSSASQAELGAAYAFGRNGTAWTQQQKFAPSTNAAQNALHFGAAVATSGNSAAIGRDNANAGGVDWFTRSGSVWSNAASSSVSSSTAHFGSALSMNDSTTAIGAYGDAGKGAETGAVSVTSTGAPHVLTRLVVNDGLAGDQFGYSLALSGSTLLVGAPGIDTAPGNGPCSWTPESGAAYVFTQSNGQFSLQKKLTAINLIIESAPLPPCFDVGIGLGTAVATDGALVLLGAPFRADWGAEAMPNTGAVFEHEYAATNASPCAQNSECISGYCVEGVCCKSGCNGSCLSCLAALKNPELSFGGDWVTGVCGEVTADTDPKNACTDQGTFCGTTDFCSGYGSCTAAHPPGTQCGAGASSSCVSRTSTAANAVCVNYTCASYFTFDCEPGYLCKNGFCKTNCQSDKDCDDLQGYICQSGLCKVDSPAEGGSGGEAGAPSDLAGAGGDSGSGGAPVAGESGAADAGEAGRVPALGGTGGTLAAAGSAGQRDESLECRPACARGTVCNHDTGHCQDIAVTSCTCRVAGRGAGTAPALSLGVLSVLALALARRRRSRRAQRTAIRG